MVKHVGFGVKLLVFKDQLHYLLIRDPREFLNLPTCASIALFVKCE